MVAKAGPEFLKKIFELCIIAVNNLYYGRIIYQKYTAYRESLFKILIAVMFPFDYMYTEISNIMIIHDFNKVIIIRENVKKRVEELIKPTTLIIV